MNYMEILQNKNGVPTIFVVNAFTTEHLFEGANLLEVSIGRDFGGLSRG